MFSLKGTYHYLRGKSLRALWKPLRLVKLCWALWMSWDHYSALAGSEQAWLIGVIDLLSDLSFMYILLSHSHISGYTFISGTFRKWRNDEQGLLWSMKWMHYSPSPHLRLYSDWIYQNIYILYQWPTWDQCIWWLCFSHLVHIGGGDSDLIRKQWDALLDDTWTDMNSLIRKEWWNSIIKLQK